MATIAELRNRFDNVVSKIQREGINDLVSWLNTTDFFEAPASTKFHGNYPGGLVEHSLHVLEFALTNFNWALKYKPELANLKQSVIISSLFHDVCKVNQYKWGEEKWTKNEAGKWVSYKGYSFNDQLPMGHGEKSVYYISKHMELTTSEILAIRWHMSTSEPGTQIAGLTQYAYQQAAEDPLVRLIAAADQVSIIVGETIDYKASAR